ADLRGIKLRGSHLTLPHILPFGCPDSNQSTFENLSIPDFSGVDLSEANLSGANISCVIMKGVNLSRANLLGTRLFAVDLSGADLRYAFIGCDYISSPLQGPYLTPLKPVNCPRWDGIDLGGADLR